jgi:hemolysin activation/secretion protein
VLQIWLVRSVYSILIGLGLFLINTTFSLADSPQSQNLPSLKPASREVKITNDAEFKANEVTTVDLPQQIVVKSFTVQGSSVFSPQELEKAVKPYQNRPITLPELFQARSKITKLYTDRGYLNSGAYIPPQELNNSVVTIAVLEGELEDINVTGTKHLNPNYIKSRIARAAGKPVNVDSLLKALQLLRLDPLIANVSAELSAGIRPGTSLLDIEVEEADAFKITSSLNNGRSPSVGTFQRTLGLNHGNLFGFGDRLDFSYTNTDGSDSLDFAYGFPINARDGRIKLAFGTNSNDVIEEPFNPLDIQSESRYYELNLRQPLILKPETEFALGLSFSRQESETSLLDTPFALSRGADEDGATKISAIRFFQELVNRDERKVFALRSQFSLGVDLFDATNNGDAPDSTFFAWRGQAQWVRRIQEDFLFLLKGDIQLAGAALVPLEQFRVGGFDSVRGYRQDLVLGDSGIFTSAELRIPLLRFDKIDGLVQLAPFFDLGTVWNSDDVELENSTLPSLGLGLNFTAGDSFNARLDWGIPLNSVDVDGSSLQEDGIYFSLDYNFF